MSALGCHRDDERRDAHGEPGHVVSEQPRVQAPYGPDDAVADQRHDASRIRGAASGGQYRARCHGGGERGGKQAEQDAGNCPFGGWCGEP